MKQDNVSNSGNSFETPVKEDIFRQKNLFRLEEHRNAYESDVKYFYYDPMLHQLYSQLYYEVAAGCGSGGAGKRETDSWDHLLEAAGNNSGNWTEDTWKTVCEDYDKCPEMRCEALDKLITLLGRPSEST